MPARTPLLLLALLAITVGASSGVALTATSTVAKSSAGRFQQAQGPNDYKPDECDVITLTALVVNKDGTAANELVVGTKGGNTLSGGLGNDCILGGGGADDLSGGGGNDVIMGGPGGDIVRGSGGSDYLYGGPGNDTCNGNAGSDFFPAGDCETINP
ncbi:MAG: hypothetical protein IT299_09880 [Dehalococcoidia bacterium]|nr:hypothetical protein [Dehalococcoidia bacterium]